MWGAAGQVRIPKLVSEPVSLNLGLHLDLNLGQSSGVVSLARWPGDGGEGVGAWERSGREVLHPDDEASLWHQISKLFCRGSLWKSNDSVWLPLGSI